MVEVPDCLLRVLFDTAVNSMDFGSGFLDDEEVACLRQAAEILGVDPMEATPENFRCKYRGHHAVRPYFDHSIFTSWVDGRQKNVYRKEDGKLVHETGCRLGMRCSDCGRRWDVFEDTALRS